MNRVPADGVTAMFSLNPFDWLGEQASETMAEGFTAMMMAVWSGAVWLLQAAFSLIDEFSPSVRDRDLNDLYGVTLWIGGLIALVLAFGQIGLAVLRQDGRGFGALAAGVIQYMIVLACWVGVAAGLITAADGLTEGILRTLLDVEDFSGYAASDGFVDQVSGSVQSAVLGVTGFLILIPAAFGHMVMMMVRSAALLVLVATMPIAAAGALSEGTKSWMWRSIRWFMACVLMEPLLAIVLGLGTQFAWAGRPSGATTAAQDIGMSIVGSVTMLVACFTPMVLFRLLAFVDPGTASGASFRATMDANGAVAGLLRGKQGASQATGSGAAAEAGPDGRAAVESGAEAQHEQRFNSSGGSQQHQDSAPKRTTRSVVSSVVKAPVRALGAGMAGAGAVAQAGAAMQVDVLGQDGVGNHGYYPTDHVARPPRQAGRTVYRPRGQSYRPFNDTNGDGVANDYPPEVITHLDDGSN